MLLTKLKACYLQRHHKNWYLHLFYFQNSTKLTAEKEFCVCKCLFKQPILHPFSLFIPFGLQHRRIFRFIGGELLQHSFSFHKISNNPTWQGRCCKENIEENVKTCARLSGLLIRSKKRWKAVWLNSLRLGFKPVMSSSYLSDFLVYSLFNFVHFHNLRFPCGHPIMRN